jgi:rhodanese-related sulfurtransferase
MAKKTVKMLVEDALGEVETWSPEEALKAQADGSAILVDIRDVRELGREGKLEDAVHAPRGMLEFWFDPESPYHREVFADESKKYVFFCAAGWRSALAAKSLKDMGFENIAHINGGFGRIRETDGANIIRSEPK